RTCSSSVCRTHLDGAPGKILYKDSAVARSHVGSHLRPKEGMPLGPDTVGKKDPLPPACLDLQESACRMCRVIPHICTNTPLHRRIPHRCKPPQVLPSIYPSGNRCMRLSRHRCPHSGQIIDRPACRRNQLPEWECITRRAVPWHCICRRSTCRVSPNTQLMRP